MGSALTGQEIKNSYLDLLQLGNSGGGFSGTQSICDGSGTSTLVKITSGGLIVPYGNVAGQGFQAYKSDGVTPIDLIACIGNNGITICPNNDVAQFVAIGSFGNRSGGVPALLLHAGSGLTMESYDYGSDLQILQADSNDRFYFGNYHFANQTQNQCFITGNVPATTFQWITTPQSGGTFPTTLMTLTSAGRLFVQAGGAISYPLTANAPAAVGGCIVDHYATVSSTHTNGTEDTLYSDSLPGATFQSLGDKIIAEYTFTCPSSASATKQFRAYCAGTLVADSGALTFTSAGTVKIRLIAFEDSTTSLRVDSVINVSGLTLDPIVKYTPISGLTLSNAQVVSVTGTEGGSGGSAGDISAVLGSIDWKPSGLLIPYPQSLAPFAYFDSNISAYQTHNGGSSLANANNNPVGLWLDLSGNGLHFAQLANGNRPLLKTSVQNGLPSIRFDGSSSYMYCIFPTAILNPSGNPYFPISQPFSVYMVANCISNVVTGNPMLTGNYEEFTIGYNNSQSTLYGQVQGGSEYNNGGNTGTVYTIEFVMNGASSQWSLNNGTPVTSGSSGTQTFSALFLGATLNTGGIPTSPIGYTNMDVFNIVILPYVLGATPRTTLMTYLRSRYNHY